MSDKNCDFGFTICAKSGADTSIADVSIRANKVWRVLVLILALATPALAHMHGHADEWMLALTNPNTKVSCCDGNDTILVDEDIRAGHYWIHFCIYEDTDGCGLDTGWQQVPDEAVLDTPNRYGHPMFWGYHTIDAETHKVRLNFRCYLPGAKS